MLQVPVPQPQLPRGLVTLLPGLLLELVVLALLDICADSNGVFFHLSSFPLHSAKKNSASHPRGDWRDSPKLEEISPEHPVKVSRSHGVTILRKG